MYAGYPCTHSIMGAILKNGPCNAASYWRFTFVHLYIAFLVALEQVCFVRYVRPFRSRFWSNLTGLRLLLNSSGDHSSEGQWRQVDHCLPCLRMRWWLLRGQGLETRHFAMCSSWALATLRPGVVQMGSFSLFLLPAGSPSLLIPSETGGKKQEGVLNSSEGHFDESRAVERESSDTRRDSRGCRSC